MNVLNKVVRIYLFIFALYHLINGIITFCFTYFAVPFNRFLYDFHPNMDAQFFLACKPWGALTIFAGLVSMFTFRDPQRYRGVIYSLIVLLLLRAGYRLTYAKMMHEVVKTQFYRNYINIAILILGAFLLLTWSLKNKGREAQCKK
ncbi:MAG: hypothetical protein AB1629_06900 [Candidatus Omnitrophota bacterium]